MKKKNDVAIRSSAAEYLTYIAATGDDSQSFEMRYEDENIWLTQKMLATLYDVEVPTINEHIKKIFSDHELQEEATIRKFRIVQTEGSRQVNREVKHYNLQVIIAVGFKVNNERAVQFRKWANQIVKDFTIKGFAMDDERLKRGGTILTEQYFEEQLQRIREIRLSERKFYQKITDIYSECSSDYDKDSEETRLFFKTVQNMMHYAVTQQTAAEIIYDRADAERPYMGLTSWKNAPDGRVVKSDVTVAKNYLSEKEVNSLNRLSNAFIDIAEQRAEDHILMSMTDWSSLLQRYMDLNNRPMLPDAGRVTHEEAVEKALTEYDKFRVIQDREIMNDFERYLDTLHLEAGDLDK